MFGVSSIVLLRKSLMSTRVIGEIVPGVVPSPSFLTEAFVRSFSPKSSLCSPSALFLGKERDGASLCTIYMARALPVFSL